MVPPSGNIIVKVFKCIWHAFKVKSKEHLTKPRYHLLDYAEAKYGKQMVYDIKCLLKILILYVPFPLFWALYDQQSSRWTFQATQMDGYITDGFTIKPDQMQVVNPVIVVFCIPLFNFVIYPLLEKVGINTPLRKMALGMALCGASFVVSGIVEQHLEQTYPVLPQKHESQLRLFNGQSCDFQIETSLPGHGKIILPRDSMWSDLHISLDRDRIIANYPYNLTTLGKDCEQIQESGVFEMVSGKAVSYVFTHQSKFDRYIDAPERSKSTLPLVRVLLAPGVDKVVLQKPDGSDAHALVADMFKLNEVDSGTYFAWIDGVKVQEPAIVLKQGGTYTMVINQLSAPNFVGFYCQFGPSF